MLFPLDSLPWKYVSHRQRVSKISRSKNFNVFKIGFVAVSPSLREFLWVFVDPQTTTFGYFFGAFVHQVCCQASQGKSVGQVRLKKPGANHHQPIPSAKKSVFPSKKKIDANFFTESYSSWMQSYPNAHMVPSNHPWSKNNKPFPEATCGFDRSSVSSGAGARAERSGRWRNGI